MMLEEILILLLNISIGIGIDNPELKIR
jgi:hypothetical protein